MCGGGGTIRGEEESERCGSRGRGEAEEMENEKEMKQSRFSRICVFCGSSQGKKRSYQDAAVELGGELVLFCFFFFLVEGLVFGCTMDFDYYWFVGYFCSWPCSLCSWQCLFLVEAVQSISLVMLVSCLLYCCSWSHLMFVLWCVW